VHNWDRLLLRDKVITAGIKSHYFIVYSKMHSFRLDMNCISMVKNSAKFSEFFYILVFIFLVFI
jgi:hypothetical protein